MDTSPAYLKGARESFPAVEVEVTRSGRDRGNGRLLDDLLDPSQIALETVRAYQPKPAFQELRQLSRRLRKRVPSDGAKRRRRAGCRRRPRWRRRAGGTRLAFWDGSARGSETG